jgi:uncharacterized protein YndB with AHSA1/START domain
MPRSVTHGSFTLLRHWQHAPERVFAAFSQEEQKAKWFAGPEGWKLYEKSFDFREGGRERLKGRHANGMVSDFDCIYRDILAPSANEPGRIIYSYVMHLDDKKISVSQATIQIQAEGKGCKLILTEYGDFLDGFDDAGSREHGTNFLMDQLAKSLES